MRFRIWIEARNFEDVKKTVLTNLFPSLDYAQANDNLELPMGSLDSGLKHQLLQSGEVQRRLNGRDATKFLLAKKGAKVIDFIQWLSDPNAV